jgi:hypothetical protein
VRDLFHQGGYYHPFFLRGRNLLALKMQRTKVKGTGARKPSSPETEPNFYSLPFVYEKEKPATEAAAAAAPVAALAAPRAAASVASPSAAKPSAAPKRIPVEVKMPLSSHGVLPGSPRAFGGSLRAIPAAGAGSPEVARATANLLNFPSLLTPAGVPSNSRRAIMAQMLATSSRLQSLRDSQSLSLAASGVGRHFDNPLLLSVLQQQPRGPLHLNANNMPCDCARPAF